MVLSLPSPYGDKPGSAVDIHVGSRLRAQRVARGVSLSTAAAALGVPDIRLNDWENGLYRIPAHHLLALSVLLSCPLPAFFEDYPTDTALEEEMDPSESKVNWLFNRLSGAKH